MADWIPGISQLKSGFQLICGDVKGAKKTQKNFVRQCPVVSQVTSAVQLIAGDEKGALETQKQSFGTLSRVADGVPIVSHAKGLVHYAFGDDEGGDRAMRSSTRTCAVIGAGATGFIAGGPVGAVALGIGAGAAMDGVYSVATNTPQGYIDEKLKLVDNSPAGGFFEMARMSVGEGMTGMADGAIVKSVNNNIQLQQAGELYNRADATLQAAEANVQSLTSAEYSLTEQSIRRVYVRCHRREHGIFEVEITGEAEPSAIVTFVGVENAHTLLRQFQANIAMGKFNDSGRGWLHILEEHRDHFQQLGLRVDSHDSWTNQVTVLTYLRGAMRTWNFIGQEFGQNGKLRFGWRVQDARGQQRILIVCYNSQIYEISGNAQIPGLFREIVTAYLLDPGENGVFTRPANYIDSGRRSNSR